MTSPRAEGVTRTLEVDHRALDALLLESERLARAASFAEAREQFAAFASRLIRHIEVEEEVLFPAIEQMELALRGPTSVMRAEHEELRALLEQVAGELAAEAVGWTAALLRLKQMLLVHDTKEERVLYPMADAAAQKAGRGGALAERLGAALAASR